MNDVHDGFALRQYENPFRQKRTYSDMAMLTMKESHSVG